jgi:lipoprotein-anchoring transpeptidase ErfK/SrfK
VKRVLAVSLFAAGFIVAGIFSGTVIADSGTTTTSTTDTTTTTAPATTTTTATTTTPAQPVLPSGVRISGIAVGGLPRADALAAVQRVFKTPLTVLVGTARSQLDPQTVASAYAATAIARARIAAPGANVQMAVNVNGSEVRAWVTKLAAHVNHAPVDATVTFKGGVKLTPDQPGVALDKGELVRRIVAALTSNTRTPLRATTANTPATVTAKDIGPVILINRSINRLFLYKNNGRSLLTERVFPVATGQSIYPTPKGTFHIVVKWVNPTWYPPTQDAWAKGLKPVPPGPDNPLGTRWMGLSVPGVGIHGTDEPASIGYSQSHGCIRMQVPDAEWLFDRVLVGTTVFIV